MFWACAALMGTRTLAAGESTGLSTAVTHKVYTPTAISPEAARQHLSKLDLATVSRLPMTNGLLITGTPSGLSRALAVLKLVDADQAYEVRLAGPEARVAKLPSNDQVIAALGDVQVGSLDVPPVAPGKTGILIDRVQGQTLVIAPASKMDQVIALLEGRVIAPSKTQDSQGASLEKANPSRIVETASWTKSHVLGAAQPEPNAVTTDAAPKTQPVTSASPSGRITSPSNESQPAVKVSAASPMAEPNRPTRAAGSNAAASAYSPPEVTNADQTLSLNLPEKLSIEDLLGFVGEYLHLDFMYDPTVVTGEVTLKLQGTLRGPIKVSDLYPLLESVLKFRGFAMTRKGNIVTVVKVTDMLDADPKLRTRSGPVEFGDGVITRVFRLKYVEPSQAQNLLVQMKLGTPDQFPSVAETKTLIVTAYTSTMPRIETLLDLVDQPGEPKQFRSRPLKYTMATLLTEKVKGLAEQLGSIQISVSTSAQPAIRQLPGETDVAFRARQARETVLQQQRAQAARTPTASPAADTVYLDADERTNRILMIGRQEQLAIVEKLVDSMDVQQQDLRSIQLYRIEHVDAQDVRKKLEELNIIPQQYTTQTPTSRITGMQRTQTQTPGQAPTPQPMVQSANETSTAGNTPLDAPQVVVVEATNALLVNATAEQHKRISEILKYVDSQTLDSAMPFELYPMQNQDPNHMAGVLEKLIKETIATKDPQGKIVSQDVVRKIEDEITIIADPCTYSLIVHASPRNQEWIGRLVKGLDKRRPQVLIDVTLVEISKNDDFNYDLNLITAAPNLSKASGLVGANGVISGSLQSGNVLQTAAGSLTGFYGDKHINALLTTMQSKKYGRVLAKPKILVNDNEMGQIKTTDTTYVKTQTSVIPTQGTSAIPSSESYQPYDAGITMDITPHISEGDLLQLKINLTRSDFTTAPKASQPPDKSQSDINTIVTVPDKSTIILGGMLKLNQTKGGSKVPILGDLPIIGAAFRSVGNSDIERKLYVFVKAEVIRPADVLAGNDALQRLSDKHRMAFEKHEAEFQKEESVPGIKDKPMSPDKVLDAQ
jgi:type II secretory pathway component GspD/PulD (secretin)